MRIVVGLIFALLLLFTAGCEVESPYGAGYGVYGEYPYTYYGGEAYPGYVYPGYGYPYRYHWHHHAYDRDHYFDRDDYYHHHWR